MSLLFEIKSPLRISIEQRKLRGHILTCFSDSVGESLNVEAEAIRILERVKLTMKYLDDVQKPRRLWERSSDDLWQALVRGSIFTCLEIGS